MATGFTQTQQGLSIVKDTEAKLTYTFEWSEWLPTGDSLATVVYTIGARTNDPDPLVSITNGITGTKTYIKLDQGQVGKTYTVSCKVTTTAGLIDRRSFRVKIEDRSA
jgi:hypothetical protein